VKRSFVFTFFLILTLTLGQSTSTHASENIKEIIHANGLYSEKQYAQAAQAYESLIHNGVRNGHLHYNLGNTYIRMGKTGPAILNYIQARKLIPRDENLQANLKFAIQQTQDQIELPQPDTLNTLFFWSDDFNLNELITISMALNLVFWVTFIFWNYFRSSTLEMGRNIFFGFLLLSIFAIGVKLKTESGTKLGVVLIKKAAVKSEHATDSMTLFQLHEGALVTVTDHHGNWFKIHLNDEQKGWIAKDSLGT